MLEKDQHAFDAERLAVVTPEVVAGWIDLSPEEAAAAAAASSSSSSSSPSSSSSIGATISSTSSSLPSSLTTFPLLLERTRKIRELGHVLLRHFQGLASNLILESNHSAVELVRLITSYFPSFRDESLYRGELIFFYKRAQIFTGDVWAAYGKKTGNEHPFAFRDMNELTMFADYRVPQVSSFLFVYLFIYLFIDFMNS